MNDVLTTPGEPKPNLTIAIVAGLAAALVGGFVWAFATVSTGYQIGYMAVGVGFLVGFAVRLGNGVDQIFGILGAIFALLGCLVGNFLSTVGFFAKEEQLPFLSALSAIDYAQVPNVMIASFQLMDLLFYGIAIYEGYRFSFRRS